MIHFLNHKNPSEPPSDHMFRLNTSRAVSDPEVTAKVGPGAAEIGQNAQKSDFFAKNGLSDIKDFP